MAEESPPTAGAAVFENSTACAPDGLALGPESVDGASRFDLPAALAVARQPEIKQYPVEASGLLHVYEAPLERCTDNSSREQFFTESLILAQDERWRRA